MDAVASYIDDNPKDFFGCDFSGDRNVFQIFFTGASDYFPAIHRKKGEKLDEQPVYIFDVADLDESGQVESLHMNFKQYILATLDHFKAIQPENIDLLVAYKDLKQFSDKLVRDESYYVKRVN